MSKIKHNKSSSAILRCCLLIKPWSRGGITERNNLQMLCAACNGKKLNYDIGFTPCDNKEYEPFDLEKWDNGDCDNK